MNWIPLPVALSFFSSAVLAGAGRLLPRRLIEAISLITTAVVGFACFFMLCKSRESPLVYWFGDWRPSSGISLGVCFYVDFIAASIAFMASILVLGSLIFSLKYFKAERGLFH